MPREHRTILAFDHGSKRIGVAISSDGQSAQPFTTIDASVDPLRSIGHLVRTHRPSLLIVGWPRGLDGQHTAQTYRAEQFAQQLKEAFDVEVTLQDEVLTSEEASKRINAKLPIKKQREQIDMLAAQVILEDYLQ